MSMRTMTSTPVEVILRMRSEEHTSELQSRLHLVCRLLLEKKKNTHELHSRLIPHSPRMIEKQPDRYFAQHTTRRYTTATAPTDSPSTLRPPRPPLTSIAR